MMGDPSSMPVQSLWVSIDMLQLVLHDFIHLQCHIRSVVLSQCVVLARQFARLGEC